MNYKLLTVCAAMVFLISSCSKLTGSGPFKIEEGNNKTSGNDSTKNPYYTDCTLALCTDEIREIPLEVNDQNSKPVILDDFYTEDMNGNKLPATLYDYNTVTSSYVVFNDTWLNDNRNSSIQVRFVGWINGKIVVDEIYSFYSDCCHVYKDSGKDKVILP